MRSLSGPKAKDKPADPIIVHPDVRKMLLDRQRPMPKKVRGYRKASASLLLDKEHNHPDEKCAGLRRLVALLTPIVKAFITDNGHGSPPTPACGCSAATASSRNGAWSSSCATTAST